MKEAMTRVTKTSAMALLRKLGMLGIGVLPVLLTASVAFADLPPGGTFIDDNDSIFEGAIEAIAAEGITEGCNPPKNSRFCPDDPVTRGEMAVFLTRAFGYSDDGGGGLFVDDDSLFYETAADRLKTAGVTEGCNPPRNNRYCGERFVTRGQMAAFIVRARGLVDDGGGDLYEDDDGSMFELAIDRLGTAEITQGCNPPDNDRFCPDRLVTRGQMAAFLARARGLSPVTPPPGGNGDPADAGEGYSFIIDDLNTGADWWRAPYLFTLPYAPGFGWGAGDRISYGCIYGFLIHGGSLVNLSSKNNWDLEGGTIYGRFTAALTVSGSGSYLRVNDGYMVEGRRFFDGSPGDGRDQLYSSGFCSTLVSEGYESYAGPDERPVIKFHTPSGEVAEIRDYRTTNAGDGIKFRLVDGDGSDGRVAVVAYKDDLPGVVVYYDALGGGSVSASPGD
jgi:hypothetical protein